MNKSNWKTWLKAAGIRAIKTVAQTAVATISTSAVISEVDWLVVGSASLLAGILAKKLSLKMKIYVLKKINPLSIVI